MEKKRLQNNSQWVAVIWNQFKLRGLNVIFCGIHKEILNLHKNNSNN